MFRSKPLNEIRWNLVDHEDWILKTCFRVIQHFSRNIINNINANTRHNIHNIGNIYWFFESKFNPKSRQKSSYVLLISLSQQDKQITNKTDNITTLISKLTSSVTKVFLILVKFHKYLNFTSLSAWNVVPWRKLVMRNCAIFLPSLASASAKNIRFITDNFN